MGMPSYVTLPQAWHEATPRWALKIRKQLFFVFTFGFKFATVSLLLQVTKYMHQGAAWLDGKYVEWVNRKMESYRTRIGEATASRGTDEASGTGDLEASEVPRPDIKGEGQGDQEPTPEVDSQRSTGDSSPDDEDEKVCESGSELPHYGDQPFNSAEVQDEDGTEK